MEWTIQKGGEKIREYQSKLNKVIHGRSVKEYCPDNKACLKNKEKPGHQNNIGRASERNRLPEEKGSQNEKEEATYRKKQRETEDMILVKKPTNILFDLLNTFPSIPEMNKRR